MIIAGQLSLSTIPVTVPLTGQHSLSTAPETVYLTEQHPLSNVPSITFPENAELLLLYGIVTLNPASICGLDLIIISLLKVCGVLFFFVHMRRSIGPWFNVLPGREMWIFEQ